MTTISTEHQTGVNSHLGGVQLEYKFPNGYGASVIRNSMSYGGRNGLYELAVLGPDSHLTYATPITDDVVGYQSEEEINDLLAAIAALPKAA